MRDTPAAAIMDDTALEHFKELLLRSCGHRFEHEREPALRAAVARRMSALQLAVPGAYHARLDADADELQRLTELLTVNETYFFREPEHLRLVLDALPALLVRSAGRPLRILSAGCSTGEEAYSVAMLLRDRYGPDCERLFAITGIDIDATAVAAARRGIYGEGSFRDGHGALTGLGRYFRPAGPAAFEIDPAIRRQVVFTVANLLDTDPLQAQPPQDVILYRNVSIYFPPAVQQGVFARLAARLADTGLLVVGASETLHHNLGILSLVQKDSLFFYCRHPHLAQQALRGAMPVHGQVRPAEDPPRYRSAPAGRPAEAVSPAAPPPPAQRYREALALAHAGRRDEALAGVDAVIADDQSQLSAWVLKANLLLDEARYDEAEQCCHQALARDEMRPEIYLMLGLAARQQGDDDAALKRFREAVYVDAACWLAHFYAAEIHFAHSDGRRARCAYQAALEALDAERPTLPLTVNTGQYAAICRHKLAELGRRTEHRNGL